MSAEASEALAAWRYARASIITDAHPENRTAADFDAFARDVLEYRGQHKGERYICAAMRPNGEGRPHRSEACALPRSWLPFDFDAIRDRGTHAELREWFTRYRGFGYETASSTQERPRARMIVATSREMDRDECMRVGAAIARDITDEFGDAIKLDPSVFRPEQAIYTPLQDAPTFILDGDLLDVDAVLASATESAKDTHGTRRPDPSADPVVARLNALSIIKRHRADDGVDIRCPFEAQHSMDGGTGETTYFPPHTGGYVHGHFKCFHTHCAERPDAEFLAAIGMAASGESAPIGWPAPLDLAAMGERQPVPPTWVVDEWLPTGYATSLSGHGGVGKSAIALHLGVCVSRGLTWAGIDCEQRRVLYLSCEDREGVLHWRLDRICRHLGINLAELAGHLDIVELVGQDSILWERDPRTGYTVTPGYGCLQERMRASGAEVLMVDGISDTFGGNENSRGDVKRYVNALLSLVPVDRGALLLIGHVNRPTAANGATSEGYSGSTAWHNAVRSRAYLYPETAQSEDEGRPHRTGRLHLELQKSNLGAPDQTIGWRWDDDAHMFLPESAPTAFDRGHQQRVERLGILRALQGCAAASVIVPAATTGQRTAYHALSARPEFPDSMRSGRASVRRFWREIEALRQLKHVEEVEHRRANRHRALQLVLTTEGMRQCV